MTTTSQLRARRNDKLITEFPLKDGLAIYLDSWKQLVFTALKTGVIAGVGVLAVGIASMFLTAAAVVGIGSSILAAFMNLIFQHPILTLLVPIVFVVVFFVLRGARGRATS